MIKKNYLKKKAKSGYKYRNFSSVTIGLVTLENHYSLVVMETRNTLQMEAC